MTSDAPTPDTAADAPTPDTDAAVKLAPAPPPAPAPASAKAPKTSKYQPYRLGQ